MATVFLNPHFDAEALVKQLKDAIVGADEDEIIKLLVSHDNNQRQIMKTTYKTFYGKELVSDIKSVLRCNIEEAVAALMTPTVQYLAESLHKSMRGAGTDEAVLIEILCTKTNEEIKAIKEAYEKEFKQDLEKTIIDDTSGHFRRMLVSSCTANRDENTIADKAKAETDATELYEAGENRSGIDASVFNKVLCARSYAHLRVTFEMYKNVTKKDITESLKSETSGDLRNGYLAIVEYMRDPLKYYADRLHKSMQGYGSRFGFNVGKDNNTLTRIIVTHSEVDLKQIDTTFQKEYNKTLREFISEDCSHDCRKVLLSVLGDSPTEERATTTE